MLYPAEEGCIALGCLCTGVLLGLLYDVFSLLRFPFHNAYADAVFDALYYLFALALCALSLFALNDGRVRLYSLGFILLGLYLFMRFPSRLVRRLLRRMAQKIQKK